MDNLKNLEVIYLALEEGEVLRDMRLDWGPEDLEQFGLEFSQLIELRDYVLDQDFSNNLGLKDLLGSIFDSEFRRSLTSEEAVILTSMESNSDFTNLSIAMGALISGDLDSLKDFIFDDLILDEINEISTGKELKKRLRECFKKWKSSDEPQVLISKLPELAALELAKLRELRASANR